MKHLIFVPNLPYQEENTPFEYCDYPIGTYRYTPSTNLWGIVRHDAPTEWRCVLSRNVPADLMAIGKHYGASK